MKKASQFLIITFIACTSYKSVSAQGDPGSPCAPFEVEDPPGSGNCVPVDVPLDNTIIIVGMALALSYVGLRNVKKLE